MGEKERARPGGRPVSFNDTGGVFLAFLPAENRTERTEQTAPGSHEGTTPRSRREGKRPSPQDLPGRPRGPRAPGPPARPRPVSLIPPDRDPLGGRNGCFQPISWGRGSRGEPKNSDRSEICTQSLRDSPRGQSCTPRRSRHRTRNSRNLPAVISPLVDADFLSRNQEFTARPRYPNIIYLSIYINI